MTAVNEQLVREALRRVVDPEAGVNIVDLGLVYGIDVSPRSVQVRMTMTSAACPSFWWNPDKYVGPAGLLQAYRFLVDSRDQASAVRLDDLEDPYRLFRCRSILNCADVCPKGLNPALAIGKIREMMVRRAI
jgi:hypothetical protein